jgi:hypothetical protein
MKNKEISMRRRYPLVFLLFSLHAQIRIIFGGSKPFLGKETTRITITGNCFILLLHSGILLMNRMARYFTHE